MTRPTSDAPSHVPHEITLSRYCLLLSVCCFLSDLAAFVFFVFAFSPLSFLILFTPFFFFLLLSFLLLCTRSLLYSPLFFLNAQASAEFSRLPLLGGLLI